MLRRIISLFSLLVFLINQPAFAQISDNITLSSGDTIPRKYKDDPEKYKTRLIPSLIVPGVLIGYGLTTIKGNGLYSSYSMQRDVQNHLGGLHSEIDDYLVLLPYAEFLALTLMKIKCKNDLINTGLLIAKSQVLMLGMVYTLKTVTNQTRPDGSNNHSFPSGHTAEAFLAATIVHKEFRHRSPWYGIGAYTIASTVGAYRIINNRHWQSDVLVGAGMGILSAHLVYATHRHKWGRKEFCMVPVPGGGYKGMALFCRF